MLEPLLQQLSAGNPEIAHAIASNPEQFLELLSEENDDDVPLPPNAQQIEVTAEERDAIERVCIYCRRLSGPCTDVRIALSPRLQPGPGYPGVFCVR
jgi:UV excision repair protein RAD23